jgi:uncharacterized repeat protein (TIGR03943 family)
MKTALVFLVWAGVLIWLIWSGRYQNFIRPGFWALLLWALIILTAFGAALYLGPRLNWGADYGSLVWVRMGVVLLPLLSLFLVQDDTLGSYAFKNRSTGMVLPRALFQARKNQLPPKDGRLTTFEVLQFLKDFVGKTIVTEGKVYRDETVPDGHFLVYRFLILCCVADALPAGALVVHDEGEFFEQDSWVRVKGRLGLKVVDGLYFPTIKADRVTPIDPPDIPYLFQPLLYCCSQESPPLLARTRQNNRIDIMNHTVAGLSVL